MTRSRVGRGLVYLGLAVGAFVSVYPLLFMLSGSFKTPEELTTLPPTLLPEALDFTPYERLFGETPFARWMLNSAIVAVARVVITLLVTAMAAFALTAYEFRGRRAVFVVAVASVLVPFEILYLPLLSMMIVLGWVDSLLALIVPFVASGFSLFLIHQYLLSVPREFYDAARLDGAGEWKIFALIAIPLMRPALGAVSIILFLQTWNSFLWPLMILGDPDQFVLPLGLSSLLGRAFHEQTVMNMVLAGSLLSTVPLMIFFLLMQRHFVAGLTRGGLSS